MIQPGLGQPLEQRERLVGALEVPGGILGTTVRLNRPAQNRLDSVKPGPDGFMEQPLNATGKDTWKGSPHIRNAYRTLVPLADNSPWSAALGPAHLPWLFMDSPPEHWPAPTMPDVWIIYRTNPAVSNWETGRIERGLERFPFVAAFAYTQDETNWYADLLLPEATDLESLQLYRVGGTKYIEQYWQHTGWALRQPAVASPCDTRDLTDVATELAARTHRAAQAAAENILLDVGTLLGKSQVDLAPVQKPFVGVQICIPEELKEATVKFLGAGLEDGVNVAAPIASLGSVIQAGLNFELCNGINRWREREIVAVQVHR